MSNHESDSQPKVSTEILSKGSPEALELITPAQENTQIKEFEQFFASKIGKSEFSDYPSFHRASVEFKTEFWDSLLDYFDVRYQGSREPVLSDDASFLNYGWFPNIELNFAENLLSKVQDDQVAISFFHESNFKQDISGRELKKQSGRFQQFLKSAGFKTGDCVAAYMPNIPETVMAMLGTTASGGVFTSTSCDFGNAGAIDRFSQSRPKVLVMASHYQYNGKNFSLMDGLEELVAGIDSIEKIVIVDFLKDGQTQTPPVSLKDKIVFWDDLEKESAKELAKEKDLEFIPVPFGSPLYIMYSSGTTGKPKCIVHTVGGTLLQHLKEMALHTDVRSGDGLFFFTTCGWMMWNWLVSGLSVGARVILFEGSPGYPSIDAFVKNLADQKPKFWGTSPKFLRVMENLGLKVPEFDELTTLLTTGAPILSEQFDYIQQHIKNGVHIASICGGTDIISCFMLGNPSLPVYRGEIQCAGLGMAVDCVDDNGGSLRNQQGELVCRDLFVSQPSGFLNDPEQTKFKQAYFETYQGLWHHGDYIRISDQGTIRVYGRSDATLNPGGVRIGTGEIYRQTEKVAAIVDSLAIGKKTEDGDVDIWLFVLLADGQDLDSELIKEIKTVIRSETTPRHVPKRVFAVKGIPYTRSGKKMEMAITKIINGKRDLLVEAVSNPESLTEYRELSVQEN